MKKPFYLFSGKLWKASVIAVSYFLVAACMQHDESLAPRDRGVANDITIESNDVGLMMKRTFTAHLTSENETADVESRAQGQVIFTLSKDGTVLHYKLIVANLDGITAAHIHCGAEGVNGPPIAWLFAGGPTDVNGILSEGSITDADVLDRSATACHGVAVATMEDLITRLRNGTAYVNVHTTSYGGGEIRGQIK